MLLVNKPLTAEVDEPKMGFSAFNRSLFEFVDVWTAEVLVSADCHSTSAVAAPRTSP